MIVVLADEVQGPGGESGGRRGVSSLSGSSFCCLDVVPVLHVTLISLTLTHFSVMLHTQTLSSEQDLYTTTTTSCTFLLLIVNEQKSLAVSLSSAS